jgi:CubicO group peptidase (beta-lactamase class C family)
MDEAALGRADNRIRQEFPNVRSVLVARDGRLVFERYYAGAGPEDHFEVYSVTKSVVSALVGVALDDGELRGVDQRLVEFFPAQAKRASHPRLRRVTLEDLLTMRAGFSAQPIQSSANWMQALMARPFLHEATG